MCQKTSQRNKFNYIKENDKDEKKTFQNFWDAVVISPHEEKKSQFYKHILPK